MRHLYVLVIIHVWLTVMVYVWFGKRNGEADRQNYALWHGLSQTRWLLGGQSREAFLRQRRLMHRLTLPFTLAFYLLAMWGIVSSR